MAKESRLSVGILLSGRGSNLIALHRAIAQRAIPAQITCVISSSETAGGLAFAREQGIPAIALPGDTFRTEEYFADVLLPILAKHRVELVVLAGFLRKIPAQVVTQYENRMINVHPALLPAFGGTGMYGRHVHEAVIAYGCRISGATVHIVTNAYDAGPPILQECVPVLDDDTPETLAARVLQIEHKLLPNAVELFAHGRIRIEGRKVSIIRDKSE